MTSTTTKKPEPRLVDPRTAFNWLAARKARWVEIDIDVDYVCVTESVAFPVDSSGWFDESREYKKGDCAAHPEDFSILQVGDCIVRETRHTDEQIFFGVKAENFADDLSFLPL